MSARQKAVVAVAVVGAVVALAVVASAMADYTVVAALIAILLAFVVVLLLDIRGRVGTVSAYGRASARRDKALGEVLAVTRGQLAKIRKRQERGDESVRSLLLEVRSLLHDVEDLRAEVQKNELQHDRDHLALLDVARDLREGRATDTTALREAIAAVTEALGEQTAAVPGELVRELKPVLTSHSNKVIMAVRSETRETEALLQALPRVPARATLPPSGLWAINPRGLAHLVDLVSSKQPRLVVELGSGTSSVWLGYLLEATGGRVVSIDHEEKYADATRQQVLRHGLSNVEVRVAPLEDVPVGTDSYRWYSPEAFADLEDIDMLLVDGPPRATGPAARWPALPVLHDRVAEGALLVLDDATRPDELEVVERWMAQYPGLVQRDRGVSEMAVLAFDAAGGRRDDVTEGAQ